MEYKDVVIDNDAIVNTEPKELPEEAQNIPQGVKPHLNPNPGYGEDGETKPAIKTDLVEGARGTPEIVGTPKTEGIKVERNLVNFIKGLLVKGKKLEDYIDSQGGVTQEELEAILNGKLGNIDVDSLPIIEIDDTYNAVNGMEYPEEINGVIGKCFYLRTQNATILYYPSYTNGLDEEWFAIEDGWLYELRLDGDVFATNEYDLSQIGQGGVKLYKHSILSSMYGTKLEFYNNKATAYSIDNNTEINALIADLANSLSLTGYYNGVSDMGFVNKLYIDGSNGFKIDVIRVASSSISKYTCSFGYGHITDTVTEL